MSRYIDADKLEYITWSLYNGHDMYGKTLFIEREIVSKQIVDAMPTADVVEVRHGEWIRYPHGSGIHCSLCRHKRRYKDANDAYCPNCGAKMDGEGENRK